MARRAFAWPVVVAIGIVCIAAGVWLGARWVAHGSDDLAVTRTVTPRGELAQDEQATIEVFEATRDAVVFITTLQRVRESPFSLNIFEQPKGTGTGFLWDARGHVVTNFHVVAEGDTFRVALSDNETYEAKLIGVEPSKDLAVLKIDPPEVVPLAIGTSGDLHVGQKVYAIGNPFGLDHSLTSGIVSALGREIKAVNGRTIHDVIQTDAAINPGNSGGPLLDSAGRLIGVNTAIYSPSGASSGIGFAVPVDTVRRVVPQLIEFGKVVRPGLGVMLVPDATGSRLKLPGPMVSRVIPGGPADRAGLRGLEQRALGGVSLGDVILAVDGTRVRTADELLAELERRKVGETVRLRIARGRETFEVEVDLVSVE
jgi:S1-C subfamily serine protease